MDMQEVKSSQIAGIAYDSETQKLRIKFSGNGKLYEYDDVPSEVAGGLGGAESVGKFFGSTIRGKFNHRIIEEEK